MNNLKTLKDLGENECGFGEQHIDREELKAEAVKKIKFIKENHKLPTGEILNSSKELYVIRYIMWDNNLSEEDLK